MALRSRVGGLLMGMLAVGVFGLVPSLAQDPAKDKSAPVVAKNTRRVPAHFGQVGLTDEQKQKIYELRAKHGTRIEELKQQLVDAQSKEIAECEALLLDSQKKALRNFVDAKAKAMERTRVRAEAKAKGDLAKKTEIKPSN